MILATLAAMVVVLFGFAGLAVDVANGYAVRATLQHAVDDASRTAQRWSAQIDDPDADPAAVQTQAVAAAVATALRDVEAGGLAAVSVVDTSLAGPHLRIAARASVPTWFLRALGISSWRPAASSDVILWTPARSPQFGFPAAPGVGPSLPAPVGPPPQPTFPEGPQAGQGSGPQPGDVSPGLGSTGGPGGGPADTGPTGGDIMEGP